MKKQIALFSALILISSAIMAQAPVDTSWKKGGFIGINFSNVSMSHWVQGGESSMALNSDGHLFANYAKDNTEWANDLDVHYALVRTGDQDIRKSDDRLEINTKYGRKLNNHWLISGLINFKSQFAPGYNYPDDSTIMSKFMAPGYLTVSPGITYKPVSYFEALISPATLKLTFVNDKNLSDYGAYGVDSGKTIRTEFGAYINMRFNKDIMKNVNLTSKLELFNTYLKSDKQSSFEVDVNWDTTLLLKVNNYITASVNVLVIYDADIIERTQFKETIGIGFGYKFPQAKS